MEILISIFIMAIGLLGLFALFPLGLLNVTRAVTFNKSTDMGRSALAELRARVLLAPERYRIGGTANNTLWYMNPFTRDPLTLPSVNTFQDWSKQPGEVGIPVAIDPVWIHRDAQARNVTVWQLHQDPAWRRSSRLGIMDALDNSTLTCRQGGDGQVDPNAWGLQRVIPTDGVNNDLTGNDFLADAEDGGSGVPVAYPDTNEFYLSQAMTDRIFGSADSLVFREDPNGSLPLVDAQGSMLRTREYTWLVTARLPDAGDEHTYELSVATFFNRAVANEQAVPAIYLPDFARDPSGQTPSNKVILRWDQHATQPELPRDLWILDATYNVASKVGPHRGYWYHSVQRSEIRFDTNAAEMHITLTLEEPARESTRPIPNVSYGSCFRETGGALFDGIDNDGNGLIDLDDVIVTNWQPNVAVVMPGVVSVYEKTVKAE